MRWRLLAEAANADRRLRPIFPDTGGGLLFLQEKNSKCPAQSLDPRAFRGGGSLDFAAKEQQTSFSRRALRGEEY